MNLDNYVKWKEIWREEVCVSENLENIDDEFKQVLQDFNEDNNIELLENECQILDDTNELLFFFSEQGGQNESDTQGWSRDYTLIIDSDFCIVRAYYEQG